MKTLYKITLLASIFLYVNSNAQQLPLFSQYYYNPFVYNPGFTGTSDMTNTYLIHRSQWKDIPGAPVTYALTIDGSVKEKEIGLGLSLFNDQTSIFNRTGLYGSYSYHLPLNSEHHIYAGVSLGVIDNRVNFASANVTDVNDPLLYGSNRRKITSDATFGVAYMWDKLKVGFSVPQLLGTKINYDENNTNVYMRLRRHFIGSVMYELELNEDFKFIPCIMTRAAKASPFQFDVNANFTWKDLVRAGLFYRFKYAAGMNVGIKLNNNLTAGYSFEYVINSVGAYSGGGHEIMLGFAFGKKDDKKINDLESKLDKAILSNDSLARELNKKDAEHDAEIKKLQEMIKNSATKDSTTGINNTPKDETDDKDEKDKIENNTVRVENVVDYSDEDGQSIPPGYYVVIESFKNKDNAKRSKAYYTEKKVYEPKIIYNSVRKFYYISVYFTDSEDNASTVMRVLQNEKPDVWVFNMQ